MSSYVVAVLLLAVACLAQGSIHAGEGLHDSGLAWGGHLGGLGHEVIAHSNIHDGGHGGIGNYANLYEHGSATSYANTQRGHGIGHAHIEGHGLGAGDWDGHWGGHWH